MAPERRLVTYGLSGLPRTLETFESRAASGSLTITIEHLQAKEDASEFLQQKVALEKEKKALQDSAAEKDAQLKAKVASIGYVWRGLR